MGKIVVSEFVILGSGLRLFDETPDATALQFAGTEALKNGVAVLTHRVARA